MSNDYYTQGELLITFSKALEEYMDSLYSAAYSMTRNRQEAEDLLQEVCLKAFEKFHLLKSRTKAKSWFFTIMTNTFINKYRKRIKSPPIIDIDVEDIFEDLLIEYENSLIRSKYINPNAFIDQEIESALSELHIDLRTVVWLSDVECFSYQEISEMLECPMGTVASRLHRGRKFLREKLLNYVETTGILQK